MVRWQILCWTQIVKLKSLDLFFLRDNHAFVRRLHVRSLLNASKHVLCSPGCTVALARWVHTRRGRPFWSLKNESQRQHVDARRVGQERCDGTKV